MSTGPLRWYGGQRTDPAVSAGVDPPRLPMHTRPESAVGFQNRLRDQSLVAAPEDEAAMGRS
jgi:hypothetical protein